VVSHIPLLAEEGNSSSNMRIVFLNPTAQIGGAERSLLDMMSSLRQAQPSWQLCLVSGDNGPLLDACADLSIPAFTVRLPSQLACLGDAGAGGPAGQEVSKAVLMTRLALASVDAARYARALRRALNELKPDLLHSNGLKMHALAACAKPHGVPLVWHIHDYISSRPVMSRLLRALAGRCSAAIANSMSVAEDFRSALKARMPVHPMWNAVDLDEFSPEGPKLDLDATSGLPTAPPNVVRIGLVGTFAKWKGHEVFLRALAMLPRDLPVRGYIIGGPVYQTGASQWRLDDLEQRAADLGISDRIGFTGFVPRPADAMRALDIVVHASTQPEPFGLVIIEAMACRRALIASHAGGASEIIRAGANALPHTPGDVNALAALMSKLVHDSSLREKLGQAGRKTAEEYFNRQRLGLQLAPIYESIFSPLRVQAA